MNGKTGIAVGAISVAAVACASALAGTGIGGVFNLGVENTVNGQTQLKGTTSNPQLKVTNQQGDAAAIAVQGVHSSASGKAPGVQGDTASTAAGATGVSGSATSSSAPGDSNGVKGVNSGAGRGVYGQSSSGPGVYGNSTSQYGVWGIGSYGVVAGGSQGGVWASTGSGAGSGVYGQNTGGGRGLFGKSSQGSGVYSEGGSYGGQFVSLDQNGGAGAWGEVSSGPGSGVRGQASVAAGTGVRGIGKWGGIFKGNRDVVGIRASVSGAGTALIGEAGVSGVGVRGKADSGQFAVGYAGLFQGEVDVQGYLKLKYQQGAPPSSECLYAHQRGRTLVVTNSTNIWVYFCGASGWRYIYFG